MLIKRRCAGRCLQMTCEPRVFCQGNKSCQALIFDSRVCRAEGCSAAQPTKIGRSIRPALFLPLLLQVFERVASDVVLGALDGINGTVFAYGQTGSGKTFTVTGGAARYADRGLIPRAISLVFAELRQRSDHTYTVRCRPLVHLMVPATPMCVYGCAAVFPSFSIEPQTGLF